MIPLIGPLISLITVGVEKYAENRKLKAEHKNAIEQKKIDRVVQQDVNDADWDKIAMENSKDSWKDEYLLILFSIPLIGAFIPGMVEYIQEGFRVLETMPEWYRYSLLAMVAASFGVKNILSKFKK